MSGSGDYISRADAIEALYKDAEEHPEHTFWTTQHEALLGIPAADVRPVVRGEWERMSDNDVFGDIHCKCSACGKDWWQGPGWFRNARFCPNCGAMMEES